MTEFSIIEPVLAHYAPAIAAADWTRLGSAGGFSGASIWRGVTPDGRAFALKAFPPGTEARQLERVHWWMLAASAAGVAFVPVVERCKNGRTVAAVDERCWEIATWMKGRADFRDDPSDAKLFAAMTAVARIHEAWATSKVIVNATGRGPCPAVLRRWRALGEWNELVQSGWRPRFQHHDPVAPHAEAAWNRLPAVVAAAQQSLTPWLERPVPLQPCLGDVWHDHILFEGERVSGVIDYAAAKVDHVAADLARLLGSLVPDQRLRMDAALAAYARTRPLANAELVDVLDRTGVVASVANWLRRIYVDNERVDDRNAVASRLAGLVQRFGS